MDVVTPFGEGEWWSRCGVEAYEAIPVVVGHPGLEPLAR